MIINYMFDVHWLLQGERGAFCCAVLRCAALLCTVLHRIMLCSTACAVPCRAGSCHAGGGTAVRVCICARVCMCARVCDGRALGGAEWGGVHIFQHSLLSPVQCVTPHWAEHSTGVPLHEKSCELKAVSTIWAPDQ